MKLFAAMLHEEKVIIAQHRDPRGHQRDHPGQGTAGPGGPDGAVVTADAAHAQHDTAEYMAGKEEKAAGTRTTSCPSRATSPASSAPSTTRSGGLRHATPTTWSIDYGHGRIIQRSLWVTDAAGWTSRTPPRCIRIRRDGYDIAGPLSPRRSCTPSPAWTPTAPAPRTSPGSPAASGASNQCTGSRHRVREDASTGYTGDGPQVMATCRNIAISLLHLAGVTEITRTLQAIGRDRTRLLGYLPL